jgi:hypothetical protein
MRKLVLNEFSVQCSWIVAQDPMMLVPIADAWAIVTHSQYVDEIARAPDDVLSFMDSAAEVRAWPLSRYPPLTMFTGRSNEI